MYNSSSGPMPSFDLQSYLSGQREVIETDLKHRLAPLSSGSRLISAMTYSLMAGGKRLRPILCLAGNEAAGGKREEALPAACALEMIHTYSLIHDDLPAMDDDKLRRGRPTCHIQFDEATAVLAGDALLNLAFEVLSGGDAFTEKTALKQLAIIKEISGASGCRGMIEGQMQDILAETNALPLKSLEVMHHLKTGALIQASVSAGGIIGGGSSNQVEALRDYGRCIGLAFQVKDDILNVEGDPKRMGKAVGTDATRRKSTYPSLMGLEASKTYSEELIRRALSALETFDRRAEPLRAISRYILERTR